MMMLIMAYLCLASGISANKVILYALSPEFLVGIRMALASIVLGGYVYFIKGYIIHVRTLTKFFAWLVIITLCTTFFPSNLKAYALMHMPSYKMAYFGTLDPYIAALYSHWWFQEHLTSRQWLAILIGCCGMLILLVSSSPFEEQLKAFSILSYPEIAALGAIVISRIGWIQGQHLLKKEHMSPLQFNVFTMGLSGILCLVLVFMRGTYEITPLAHAEIPLLGMSPFSSLSLQGQLGFLILYTTLIGNVLGYSLYGYALKRYSATFVALAGFLIPLIVQLIGWLVLGEPLSVSFFVACLITFAGVALFLYDERPAHHNNIS